MKNKFLDKLKEVNTFIFDIDGVLTDGTIWVTDSGELIRGMNVKDGYALQLAVKKGYNVAVISGAHHKGIVKRLNNLGIKDIFIGCSNKLPVLKDYLIEKKVDSSKVLYMADDIPDYEVFNKVGVRTCPKDAVPEIFNMADYVSPFSGGTGCVRDVIEKTLKLHNKWMDGNDVHIW